MKGKTKENPTVLAVIPARGGSKRLPRKNIINIGEHPMIAYTIMAVKEALYVTDWLVSSDDDEIIKVAYSYGANIPFKRPADLSTDTIRNIDVVSHALNYMENNKGYKYDIIILLQPTSPIRDPKHIDEAIMKLWESDQQTLASVKGPYQKRDPILKKLDSDGHLISYCSNDNLNSREPFYIYNASIYAVKRDYFVKNNKLISEKQIPLVMDKYFSIDVDDISDLLVAESYLKYIRGEKNAST